ncbi:MAG: hypothetical protein P0121_06025 [Nitrospira sp.]|nr:hypothetical protein [Nitrospira sp.]
MSFLILWADQDGATLFQIRQSIFKADIRELLVAKMRNKMVRENGVIPPIALRPFGFEILQVEGDKFSKRHRCRMSSKRDRHFLCFRLQ